MNLEADIRAFLTGRGTSRLGRRILGLDPSSFRPDDREQWDDLHFAERYASLIKYYNLQNQPDGNWSAFFSNDLSIFIAGICATRLDHFQARKEELVPLFQKDEMVANLHLLALIRELGILLTHWYVDMPDELSGHDHVAFKPYLLSLYKARIAPLLQELEQQVAHLKRYQASPPEAQETIIDFDEFEQRLKAVNAILDSGEGFRHTGAITGELLSNSQPQQILSHLFSTFFSTAQHVHLVAPDFLARSNSDPHHAPHIALYITFLKAMGVVKDSINDLTRRHLEFYYTEVLRLKPEPAVPDRVHLRWQLAPTIRSVLIPQGTQVVAGADSAGREFIFETAHPLYATQAELVAVRTLFNAGRPGRHSRPLYAAPVADSKDGMGMPFPPGTHNWPTFGQNQRLQSPAERNQQPAQLGFAIADPVLLLQGGLRTIRLRFRIAEDTHQRLYDYVDSLPSISSDDNLTRKFIRLFTGSFDISYTGPEGWVEVNSTATLPFDYNGPEGRNPGQAELIVGCRITADYPAVVALDPALHGSEYLAQSPVFKFVLSHDTTHYAYNPLSELLIKSVIIETDVEDLREVVAAGDQSAFDTSKPFTPFGVAPIRGASFYLGSKEVFSKTLESLKVRLNWFGLPQNEDGLHGYYADFRETEPDMAWDNFAFRVKVSILSGGKWVPEEAQRTELPLFRSAGKAQALDQHSTFDNLDISFVEADPNLQWQAAPLMLGPLTRSGFLRFELSSPPQAFGHALHQKVITRIMDENTDALIDRMRRFKLRKAEESKPLPTLPFSPTVQAVSLDYTASAVQRLDPDTEPDGGKAFYHIHPFGVSLARPHTNLHHPGMLPSYRRQGYLFMGLQGQEPGTPVTLHFQMVEGSGSAHDFPGNISWSYWAGHEWRPFRREDLLSDSTNGMLRSGILSLFVPEDAVSGCPPLGDTSEVQLHWIRAVVDGGAEAFALTQSIATQAVEAEYKLDSSPDRVPGEGLAPNSITRLRHGIAGVASVSQPYMGFGGRNAETFLEFCTRVSERLRHKGRALTLFDYQHLVLQRFPQVFKVKCLPHSTVDSWLDPGHVIIVVIPHVPHETGHLRKEPRASIGLLEEIRAYLASVASPFVKITVRYPTYEFLAVRTRIRLRPNADAGTSLRQIDSDLIRFLSPWSDDDGKDIPIGGIVYRSAIHEFLTRHPLVEEVEGLRLYHILRSDEHHRHHPDEGDGRQVIEIPAEQDDVQSSQPWAVLTSVKRHSLSLSLGVAQRDKGIASTSIGHDFQVGQTDPDVIRRQGINHMVIVSEASAQRIERSHKLDCNTLIIRKPPTDPALS
jgi:hypothetical protein